MRYVIAKIAEDQGVSAQFIVPSQVGFSLLGVETGFIRLLELMEKTWSDPALQTDSTSYFVILDDIVGDPLIYHIEGRSMIPLKGMNSWEEGTRGRTRDLKDTELKIFASLDLDWDTLPYALREERLYHNGGILTYQEDGSGRTEYTSPQLVAYHTGIAPDIIGTCLRGGLTSFTGTIYIPHYGDEIVNTWLGNVMERGRRYPLLLSQEWPPLRTLIPVLIL